MWLSAGMTARKFQYLLVVWKLPDTTFEGFEIGGGQGRHASVLNVL